VSRERFDAKRLAAILIVGALLFIAAAAYVISRQALPPTYLDKAPAPTAGSGSPSAADGAKR
jgi:hypothetical protein